MVRYTFLWAVIWTAVLAAMPFAAGVSASELRLEGEFQQGSLIRGHTETGAKVTLGSRDVRVTADGNFIFGFGWNAPEEAVLEVVLPDGTRERRSLAVAPRQYDEQRIDGLPEKMVSPPPEVLARIKAENARIAKARAVDAPRPLYETGFVWPVTGPISGIFGSRRILNGKPRRPHFGVDIAAPEGTIVKAPSDAVVVIAESDMYFTGGTIVLDHGHGLTSVYSHLAKVLVSEGDELRQGDPIGKVGHTGRVTGAHLDWRINWFDQRLDPALFVPPMPASPATPAE
jgi:murein DD-endopeptidase MepM/ murein hydrolase activator NlpD